jgi:NADH-quinone oxidoreductase subunit J
MIQLLAFYLFAALVIVAGASTIFARNPVHSVLWLILAFFNAAGLMVLVGAEFIAMLLVIVYVGAVAVLFLFVVMMLDVDFATLRAGFTKNLPLGVLIALVLVAELLLGTGALKSGALVLGTADVATAAPQNLTNTAALGALMYSRYLFLFETAGIILTVSMIGAIVLTHRKRGDVKMQNISRQNARRPQDATVNLKPGVGQGVEL